jgi:hypothetical protein
MRVSRLRAILVRMSGSNHPEGSVRRELQHLEQVAEVGASSKTPLILVGGVWLLCAAVVLVVLAVTLVVTFVVT